MKNGFFKKIKEYSFAKVAAMCLAICAAGSIAKAEVSPSEITKDTTYIVSSEQMSKKGLKHGYVADMTEALVRAGVAKYDETIESQKERNFQLRMDWALALAKLEPGQGWEDYVGTPTQNSRLRLAILDGKLANILNGNVEENSRVQWSGPEVNTGELEFPDESLTNEKFLNAVRDISGPNITETALGRYGISIDDLLKDPGAKFEDASGRSPEDILSDLTNDYDKAEMLINCYRTFGNRKGANNSSNFETVRKNLELDREVARDIVVNERYSDTIAWANIFLEDKELSQELWEVYQRVKVESGTLREAREKFTEETGFGSRRQIVNEDGSIETIVDIMCDSTFRRLGEKLEGMYGEKEKESVLDNLRYGIATSFAGDHTKEGTVIGDGPINQTQLSLGYKNLTFGIWATSDLKDWELDEIDYRLNARIPIWENGRHRISGNLGFEFWDYFPDNFRDYDSVVKASLSYRGIVDANIGLAHLLEEGGDDWYANVAKSFPITDDIFIRPNIRFSYPDEFFDAETTITPSVSVGIKTDNFIFYPGLGYQIGLEGKDNRFLWGISAKFRDKK